MSGEQQYAPGDPVLVAGIVRGRVAEVDLAVQFNGLGGSTVLFDATDVHPAPPTPDPRDTAITEVRRLHGRDFDGECEDCRAEDGGWVAWPCDTVQLLDGVVPVPAPSAPTLTGWTAELVAGAIDDLDELLSDYWSAGHEIPDGTRRRILAERIVERLARRAEEAAAAAPATTDEERLEAMCQAAYGAAWSEMAPESRSERRAGMHRALLAAGSPS